MKLGRFTLYYITGIFVNYIGRPVLFGHEVVEIKMGWIHTSDEGNKRRIQSFGWVVSRKVPPMNTAILSC
jgi:hypothetical protein